MSKKLEPEKTISCYERQIITWRIILSKFEMRTKEKFNHGPGEGGGKAIKQEKHTGDCHS